jgi:hypothetical protein
MNSPYKSIGEIMNFEEMVKRTYFYCENKDPKGLYPDEIDLLEFSNKLIQAWEANQKNVALPFRSKPV